MTTPATPATLLNRRVRVEVFTGTVVQERDARLCREVDCPGHDIGVRWDARRDVAWLCSEAVEVIEEGGSGEAV